MCHVFNVSRTCYYAWVKHQPTQRSLRDAFLKSAIKESFLASKSTYGTRRIRAELGHQKIQVSRRRIGRLMREEGLICKMKRKFKKTTDSNHSEPISPNLLNRNFDASAPNKKFVGDITYIRTNEGWLYLAIVIDLYSRRVVGWSMRDNMKTSLVNDALLMALRHRRPSTGLIWHTDRGSQYASKSHRKLLSTNGISQSMSRKGDCWDNSVAESFFHTLKTEMTFHYSFSTKEEAKQAVFEYIEVFYNRKRLHSSNQYMSPVDFENKDLNKAEIMSKNCTA